MDCPLQEFRGHAEPKAEQAGMEKTTISDDFWGARPMNKPFSLRHSETCGELKITTMKIGVLVLDCFTETRQ